MTPNDFIALLNLLFNTSDPQLSSRIATHSYKHETRKEKKKGTWPRRDSNPGLQYYHHEKSPSKTTLQLHPSHGGGMNTVAKMTNAVLTMLKRFTD